MVTLTVYDLLGREAAKLVNDVLEPGNHEVPWKAINVASGVYVYRLRANSVGAGMYSETRKLVLLG